MVIKPQIQRKLVGGKVKKAQAVRSSGRPMSLREKQAVIEQLKQQRVERGEVIKEVQRAPRLEGMSMKIAKAAEAVGMWEKDVVRFADFIEQYGLEGWTPDDVKDARRINQSHTSRLEKMFEQIRRNHYEMDKIVYGDSAKQKRSRVPDNAVAVKPVVVARVKIGRGK